MHARQRILSAIQGKPLDRIPWSPFLAYWWEAQPENLTKQGMIPFLESIGADPLMRGFGAAWKIEYAGVKKTEAVQGNRRVERLHTPVGELVFGYRYSADADTWFLFDHPVQDSEDLKTLMWIYEHAKIVGNPGLHRELAEAGDRALILPILGSECKTCFQSLVEKYIDTVNLAYLLADEPDSIEECLSVMRHISDQTATFSAESDADGFIFWEDSSTTNMSPAYFSKYAAPEIKAWGDTLHRAGKLLIHHACGHVRDLLPLMAELPIDAVESLSPPPTGNIDILEAFEKLPEHIAIIGGIEPVFFERCTIEELEARVDELKRVSAGRRYVLANSDSCPPGVALAKMKHVANIL